MMANRGRAANPHLVKRVVHHDHTVIPVQSSVSDIQLDSNNVESIVEAMIDVVHGARGTARRISQGIDYQIAGKTGTAQVFTVRQEESYNESEVDKKLRDHALFVAFAPADHPRIAISVIVENGGHGGSVAAPIAGEVIKKYLAGDS